MDFILRLKNWQLFLIIFILPWVIAIGLTLIFKFDNIGGRTTLGIYTVIYYAIFIVWNYKVIKTFNKTKLILKPKQIKRLDWLLIIFCFYAVFLIFQTNLYLEGNVLTRILSQIIILFSIYTFIFLVFCTAKTLKGLQLKNDIRTSDIIIEMFVIFYFPVGVWWLQKKVNRLFIEK